MILFNWNVRYLTFEKCIYNYWKKKKKRSANGSDSFSLADRKVVGNYAVHAAKGSFTGENSKRRKQSTFGPTNKCTVLIDLTNSLSMKYFKRLPRARRENATFPQDRALRDGISAWHPCGLIYERTLTSSLYTLLRAVHTCLHYINSKWQKHVFLI